MYRINTHLLASVIVVIVIRLASAQSEIKSTELSKRWSREPLSLTQSDDDRKDEHVPPRDGENHDEGEPLAGDTDEFFNIREANPRVDKGEWELEIPLAWTTRSNHHRDDVNFGIELSYGITDDMYAELELLPVALGDGGDQGNGDLGLTLYNRFVREEGSRPAIAGWVSMRIPSGQGSSGVDGELHAAVTKTLIPKFRMHVEGYVETDNGGRGNEDREDRRAFQWGIGPGFDYELDPKTVFVWNYINRASEERGEHNENVFQIGGYRRITPNQSIKAAIEVGLDGQPDTPNIGVKLQYEITFGK